MLNKINIPVYCHILKHLGNTWPKTTRRKLSIFVDVFAFHSSSPWPEMRDWDWKKPNLVLPLFWVGLCCFHLSQNLSILSPVHLSNLLSIYACIYPCIHPSTHSTKGLLLPSIQVTMVNKTDLTGIFPSPQLEGTEVWGQVCKWTFASPDGFL